MMGMKLGTMQLTITTTQVARSKKWKWGLDMKHLRLAFGADLMLRLPGERIPLRHFRHLFGTLTLEMPSLWASSRLSESKTPSWTVETNPFQRIPHNGRPTAKAPGLAKSNSNRRPHTDDTETIANLSEHRTHPLTTLHCIASRRAHSIYCGCLLISTGRLLIFIYASPLPSHSFILNRLVELNNFAEK